MRNVAYGTWGRNGARKEAAKRSSVWYGIPIFGRRQIGTPAFSGIQNACYGCCCRGIAVRPVHCRAPPGRVVMVDGRGSERAYDD